MKLAFLGTGQIVKDLLRTIHKIPLEDKVLLGTQATREEAEGLAETYGFSKVFYDYDELLTSDIDTVYVALPNFLHYSFTKKALEAGKHVIVEKPVTTNYKEFKELRKLAEEKGLMMFEAMNVHYLPAYKEVKKNLEQLGDIKIVSLNYSQYSSRYDQFKAGITLPVFDPHKAGGALMDLNVYNIHFLIGLFGEPKSVSYLANIEKDIDTSGILTLDYGSFKAVTIGAKDCKAPISSSIQGDKGSLQIHTPANQLKAFEVNMNDGSSTSYECKEDEHRLYYEFLELIRIVNEHDTETMKRMLDISGIVSKTMQEARQSAGIVFDND